MNYTIYTKTKECAERFRGKDALVFYGKRIKYQQLLKYIDDFAEGLISIGIKPKDVVSICLPNSPSAVIAFYALNKIGAISNLFHPLATVSELTRTFNIVGSKVLITYDGFMEKNEAELPTDIRIICTKNNDFMGFLAKSYYSIKFKPKSYRRAISFKDLLKNDGKDTEPYIFGLNEEAVYLPSGGTTGDSKIIMHNCRSFNDLAMQACNILSSPMRSYKAMYSVLPIFHGFGLCINMHLCTVNGITNVMCLKFDPSHLAKSVAREKVAILTGVPSMYVKLLKSKDFRNAKLASLQECFVGGDQISKELTSEFNTLLKNKGSSGALFTGYGLTETVTVNSVISKRHYKEDSVGYPLPPTKIAIIKDDKFLGVGEVGEICVCSHIMMLGYYKSDLPIKEINGEKWLFTGDYGYLDIDGYLFFKQRIKNTIKVSGIPVFPSEMEAVLEKIEGVMHVAVIGIKDEERGEVVKVIVEPFKNSDIARIKEQIKEVCKKEFIVYAQPKQIEFIDMMPISMVGKIDRGKLK